MTVDTTPAAPSVTVEAVTACVADVLDLDIALVNPDARLTELGLESFTAVRLRRRLRDELGLDLPLTAFLDDATARTLAGAADAPDETGGNDGESFTLTPIQAAYLVGRDPAFPLGGVATFFYYEYDRMPGTHGPETDLHRLETAWNSLVARHPMLRMVVGPDARQRVLPTVAYYRFEVTDLRAASEDESEHVLQRLRARCSHQLRPTDTWPLFDIRAAYLPDGRMRLFVGVDVLALDLASWMRLMREWGALVADPDTALPEPPVTFADLVRRREQDPAEADRRQRDRAYWAKRAATLPPGPALPWSAPADQLGVPHFTRHGAELPAAAWTALRDKGAARGLSPTGVLLAAFALVLHRWGATAAFCLNTTLFDRDDAAGRDDSPGLEMVLGDFTSTVLVQVPKLDLAGWSGFDAWAAQVNRQFWTDLEHRSVSGVEALRDVRGPQLTPEYPVVFTSGVGLAGAGEPPTAWLGHDVFGVSQTPQVLLDHIVWDEGDRLRVAWDAVDGALPVGFVAGMLAAHTRLLHRLAIDDGAWTDPALGWDPSFLPDQALGCRPFGDAGPLLDDPRRAAAQRTPQATALLSTAGTVSHGELDQRAQDTARALAGYGVGPGDLVALAAQKGPGQVAAALGVNTSGAGYVPVEPSWPAARVASLCAQAGIRYALVAPDVDLVWPSDVTVHRLTAAGAIEPQGAGAQPRRPGADDLAYAMFTSGSTGHPKGVAIEHRAVRTTLDDLADRFPLRPDDRVLALAAFSFDLSVYDIFAVLGAGGALVVPDHDRQRDPGHWLELMREHQVTVWNTAPALLEMLVEYAEIDPDQARTALASLRLVLLSADWIPVSLPDRIRALAPHAQVVSLGGATEGSIWSICFPVGEVDPAWPSIPYGRALRGQSFHILDEHGVACPAGEVGELYIGGDGLARGYVGDPEQTAQRFTDHPILRRRVYRTGDLGRWRSDGTIEFLGRLDRQVKIRGHRIELGEVESALDRAPGVRQCVARSVPGPDDRPRLVAYIVPSDPARPPTDDELIAQLRDSVPEFMVPSRFVGMDGLPVTTNGKIDYAALPSPYRTGRPPAAPAAVPTQRRADRALPQPAAASTATADRLGGLVGDILGRGLSLTLTIGAGELPPSQALAAAAAVSAGLPSPADGGPRMRQRLSERGLLEIVLADPPTPRRPDGPTHEGTADMPDGDRTAHGTNGDGGRWHPAPVERTDVADPEVERSIARVFSDLLKAPVDVTTPFFRLGATSLTMVLAQRQLVAELDPELTVVDLFARPTVRELALFITERRDAPPAPPPADTASANGSGAPTTGRDAEPAGGGRPSRRHARALAAEAAR
jgi:amino acid adenylation domain-containing protein